MNISQINQLADNASQLFNIGAKVADCGVEPQVNRHDLLENSTSHALFDFSQCLPTVDQQQINCWLAEQDVNGKAILHLGAGNSSVASQSTQAKEVVAVTVAANEKRHGDSLNLPNYEVIFENKYNTDFCAYLATKKFDYILDNNLASFVCCEKHFLRYFAALVNALADDGMIVTHWLGMQWVLDLGIDDTETCWLLDDDSLAHIAKCFDLTVTRQDDLFFLTKLDQLGVS